MLVGVAPLPPLFLPSETKAFYIINISVPSVSSILPKIERAKLIFSFGFWKN